MGLPLHTLVPKIRRVYRKIAMIYVVHSHKNNRKQLNAVSSTLNFLSLCGVSVLNTIRC